MPIVNVNGVGQVQFPDDMSDADISAAIKTNLPKWDLDRKRQDAGKNYLKTNAAGGMISAVEGIPVLGQLVKKALPNSMSQPLEEIQQENPVQTGVNKMMGGVASTLPLGVGLNTAARGSTIAESILGALGYGGLGTADKAAEKGSDVTNDELKKAFLINAVAGGTAPVVSRAFTPNPVTKLVPDKLKQWTTSATEAEKTGSQEISQETINDLVAKGVKPQEIPDLIAKANTNAATRNAQQARRLELVNANNIDRLKNVSAPDWVKNIPYNLGGALVGHMATGGMGGAIVGHTLGPLVKPAVENGIGAYWGNQVLASPTNRAFLQAVMGNAGIQAGQ